MTCICICTHSYYIYHIGTEINGFGQSPIVISPVIEQKCDTDLSGYEFEQGDCTWDELFFQILTNGVWVGPNRVPGSPNTLTPDVVCNLGRMKIPGDEQWYIANQFHIHSNSGKYCLVSVCFYIHGVMQNVLCISHVAHILVGTLRT